MDAYKDVFLSESAEYIQSIIDGLLELESNPNDLDPVETVFRGAHSLKGMSATMGYDRTSDLTHKMESLMDTVRKREQPVDHSLIDLMLDAVDAAKALIEAESSGGATPDVSELVDRLVSRTESKQAPPSAEPSVEGEPEETMPLPGMADSSGEEAVYHVKVTLEPECVLKSVRAYMVLKRLSHLGMVVETTPSARELEDEEFDRAFEVVVRTAATPEQVVEAASFVSEVAEVSLGETVPVVRPSEATPASEGGRKPIPKLSETQTVRISIGHLDNMVNLVGELVILRSRLERMAHEQESKQMLDSVEDLRRISSELQHEVMQTRMVPVGNIFNRFPRMVRDLARDLGKDLAFETDGLDIELDRTVLDEIGDPIVHLLRNAVDHGVEPPEERKRAGKPERATVRLVASRERDQVQIIVTDDGRGLDVGRIWAKACERGMVEESERENYSEEAVLLLTCEPGFSTAAQATKVSGRGVGMDVVRGKIEYLGGSLFIRSKPGAGAGFILTLPLTLAIIQALMVESASGQIFALPLGSVAEVLSPEDLPLQTVDGKPVVVLRNGSLAPLYHLGAIVGEEAEVARPPRAGESVVLVEMGGQARALAAQSLLGRQEIVIKPLGRMFRNLRGLSGATVLGDGSIALILDPRSLFTMGDVT